jgi:hypothetical protein
MTTLETRSTQESEYMQDPKVPASSTENFYSPLRRFGRVVLDFFTPFGLEAPDYMSEHGNHAESGRPWLS